jgi:uncharacterized protein (DUF488 family)
LQRCSLVAMTDVYTIGHSNHPIDKFLDLLRAHDVSAIADVRSHPYSRFNPQFGAKRLAAALATAGIRYELLGRELGARSTDEACLVDGRVDYGRLARTPPFAQGLDRVAGAAQRERVALLCAERDPFDCHRAILVCRELARRAIDSKHIREDGRLETRAELETRLLDAFGADEPGLFGDRDALVDAAYRCRGRQIAYAPLGGR